MDLKRFLKENNGFPENQKISVSPCFEENGEEVLWVIRAVSEEEYRRAAEGKKDKWAALCLLSVVKPDLKEKELWESYGEDAIVNSKMAVAALTGLQGDAPNHIGKYNVATSMKHYMAYGAPFTG